jgi:Tol biopolymer transport system component
MNRQPSMKWIKMSVDNQMKARKLLNVAVCTIIIVSCQNVTQNTDAYVTQIVDDRLAGTVLWSPIDSSKLLVSTVQGGFGQTEIKLIDTETGEKKILVQTENGNIFAKTWSPDGREAIFASLPGTEGFERGGLWIVNVYDNSIRFLQDNSGDIVWGPTQDQLTFVRVGVAGTDGEIAQIVIKNLQTYEEDIIYEAEETQEIFGLSWSPEKDMLVFAGRNVQPAGDFNVFVLDMNSQQVNQLTESGDNTYPTWSPTRDQIAYRNKTYSGNTPVFSLHLVNSTGTCRIKLHETDLLSSSTWSPDGNSIVFVSLDGIYSFDLAKFIAENGESVLCR